MRSEAFEDDPAAIVTVTPTILAPASIGQGADYALLKLSMVTDQDTAVMTAIRITKSGTLANGSVLAVRIYLDDGNGVYGPEDTQLATGAFPSPLNLTLSPSQTLTTTPKVYYLVYVLASGALIGNTIGGSVAANTDVTVTAPDLVAATNFPINSGNSTVAAQELGVILSETLINLGNVDVNTEYVVPTFVNATNLGNVPQTYDLKAQPITGGTPWTIGAARGFDVFTLHAVTSAAQPSAGDFGSEDKLLTVGEYCSSTIFALGTARCDKQGLSVATKLWLKLGMPTITSTDASQDIQVTVTTNP